MCIVDVRCEINLRAYVGHRLCYLSLKTVFGRRADAREARFLFVQLQWPVSQWCIVSATSAALLKQPPGRDRNLSKEESLVGR